MNEETSANIQEVAAPETVEENSSEVEETSTEAPKSEEVAKPQQDSATNAAFAQMRRDAEAAKRKNDLLMNSLKQYGYQGSEEEIADQLMAQKLGKNVDDVRNERIRQQQQFDAQQRAKAENDYLVKQVSQYMMQEDLRKIQAIDPTVKSLEELGQDFIDLISKGTEVEIAYHAVKAKENAHKKPVPKNLGPIGTKTQEKDFFTKDEVDNLTDKQLDDPKIWNIVRKSMLKW